MAQKKMLVTTMLANKKINNNNIEWHVHFICICLKCYKGANKLEIIIYLGIFIIGTLLGSFFSLAVYRIPLKQDITHKRSYCPKCNHKLGFWDMIPILSYIFLGGKCRYCKEKIRSRYICLEIFSGLLFLLFALSLKIDVYSINVTKIIYLLFGIFYISTLFIMGGIEKENHYISKEVLLFGLSIEAIYIIYLYILNNNMYKYGMYLIALISIIVVSIAAFKQKRDQNYTFQILNLCLYLAVATNEFITIISIGLTLLISIINKIIDNMKTLRLRKTDVDKEEIRIPLGFYLCFSNILALIVYNFLN